MAAWFVYITAKDKSQALQIGRALVEEHLAACINVWDGMHSIYRWEGAVEEASEAVLMVKTSELRVPEIVDRVKALHTYACPCVAAWPIDNGNPSYLEWIERESG
jgi:periplasmic divalent cation tolerance protein